MKSASSGGVRAIVTAAIAVALEGYDLAIYGIFALALSTAFFPAHEPATSLLLTVGTLGVGYVVRPLGGIILGAYADRVGRRAAIALTVALLSVSTGAIGIIPAADRIGLAAPILVVVARLVQGFAAGGAAAGTIAFLTEAAPKGRRGFYASWQQASQVGAFLFSVGVGTAISALLPHDAAGWSWRIPFLLALIFGPLGFYIRSRLPEPEAYIEAVHAAAPPPLASALHASRWAVVAGLGLSCLWNMSAFVLLVYMPTWVQKTVGLSASHAFAASTAAALLLFILCPIIGLLADRLGRKPLMLTGAIGLMLLTYPLLWWMSSAAGFGTVLAAELILAILIALYTAPISAMLAELFPTQSRSTGLSVAYNISVLIVGAFGPLIVTWLIAATGSALAPGFYIAMGAAVSTITLLIVRDRTHEDLREATA